MIHLGDYIYEYGADEWGADTARTLGRVHQPAHEIVSLSDYRTRHAQYKLDADLSELHRQFPFITVWDDHESANDSWRDGAENHQSEEGAWAVRKAAASRAYREWLPVADTAYSAYQVGDLATLFRLDTRLEGRDEQLSVEKVMAGAKDPQALMAALQAKLGHEEVGKTSIAVQGLGHIGMELVKLLRDRGAKLYVTDLDASLVDRAVSEYGAEAVKPDEIHEVNADVFAPCALEGAISLDVLPRLKARIICGTANNQLANPEVGDELHARGILYAPDYAVNAGGVMNVSLEIDGYNRERAMRMMRTIYHNLHRIYEIAERDGVPTYQAADRLGEERIAAIGKLKLPLGRTAPRFMGHLRGEH